MLTSVANGVLIDGKGWDRSQFAFCIWVLKKVKTVGCHYFPNGLQLPPQPLRVLVWLFSKSSSVRIHFHSHLQHISYTCITQQTSHLDRVVIITGGREELVTKLTDTPCGYLQQRLQRDVRRHGTVQRLHGVCMKRGGFLDQLDQTWDHVIAHVVASLYHTYTVALWWSSDWSHLASNFFFLIKHAYYTRRLQIQLNQFPGDVQNTFFKKFQKIFLRDKPYNIKM